MDTIPALFASAVERFGNQPALIEPTEGAGISTLTYRMVQERVHGFAGYLQSQSLQKGTSLIIWSGSRADWLIVYLGALLVGVVVVPLDINSKEDFLTRIVETTGAQLLVATQKQYDTLKEPPIPLVNIDALPQASLDVAGLPVIGRDDLAELVFTSGTTGTPKGVMLSHYNIVSNATAAVKVVDIRAGDRLLSILPLSHMFELTIEIAIMHIGATVVYARSLVPDTLLRLMKSQRINVMVLVPQALQLFINGIERVVRQQKKEQQFEFLRRIAVRIPFGWRRTLFRTVHTRFGGHFRFFVSGGAYLPPKLAMQWELMGFRILQGYGATECSPVISVTPMHDHNYESAGKSLPGVEVQIADDKEILVHGPNVALGYWKSPEETAAAFQNGWYHTGDLGYLDEHGSLYLKGRKKNLIVLANGLNVYPEDIENVLHTNPLVKDVAVFGLMKSDEGPQVHAVLLLDDPAKVKTIIQQANKQLAAHQQIRGFTIWPEADFPRTNTLKVKRPDVLDALQQMHAHS
ncbi:MAG TPA: AMP-binding protein [Ktedonobacteraceae bacterium]|nr:AMP-binding protein [Ktedonobacteraceae bacterium]